MIFNAIGVCQLYLNIFHTVFRTVVVTIAGADPGHGVGWFFDVKYFVVPIAAACLLPFAFKRSTDGLKWTSWVSVGASIIFIVSVFIAFGIRCHNGNIHWGKIGYFWTQNGGNAVKLEDRVNVGLWGTRCTCPNGEEYWVGSVASNEGINNCLNFACYNGTTDANICKQSKGFWSYSSVTCAKDNYTRTSLIDIASHLPQIVMAYTFQFNFFSFYKSL